MQHFFTFPLKPGFNFANFVKCDANTAALNFSLRVADLADPEKLLYLHGPSGSGKTHLLKAIAGELYPYISMRDTVKADELVSAFTGAAGMVIDDLHEMPADASMQRTLWQLFNDFHTSGRLIAISGARPPRELDNVDDHLISRLLWGLVARLDTSDDESRRMIIAKVAEDYQIRVPEDVVKFMLDTTSRDTGALLRFFSELFNRSMAENRRITVPLARGILQSSGGNI